MKNKLIIIAVAICAAVILLYSRFISPTYVGFVNFMDAQYANIIEANNNPFIKIERIDFKSDKKLNLDKFDAIYFFAHGINLAPEHIKEINKVSQKGTKLYMHGLISGDTDLGNLQGEEKEMIRKYMENGGNKNIRSLLDYSRKKFDKKLVFAPNPAEPKVFPKYGFFYLGEEDVFEHSEEYQEFYEQANLYKEGRPRVAIVASIIGKDSGAEVYEPLIKKLEDKQMNVYPMFGNEHRLEHLKEISPSLVIIIPHGRLEGSEGVEWLKKQNVPMLAPQVVFAPYDTWLKDQKGIDGGMLSQNIVMPEIDGGVYPYTIAAQFPSKSGLNIFKAIEGRLDTFVDLVDRFIRLKTMSNFEKRIAIYYYKGTGENAMVAEGLEIAPSLLNVLERLKGEGYNTGELPESADSLYERIQQEGRVLGHYAKGTFEEYLKTGNPILIKKEKFVGWMNENLQQEMIEDMKREYGDALGPYMTTVKDGVEYISVAKVQFGNVVLLPVPAAGYGKDESKLVHGAKKPVPYPYAAAYYWGIRGFNADAFIHFGTHGSVEFTPWKQNALSEFDWPDAMLSGVPHFYLYSISNIGEALIAKRRSYSTMMTHITPPFTEAGLYSEVLDLHVKTHDYNQVEGGVLKEEYRKSIKNLVLSMDLHKDIGLDDLKSREITEADIQKLEEYTHNIESEKIMRGLYNLGERYEEKYIKETVGLIAVDYLAHSLKEMDEFKNKVLTKGELGDHGSDNYYRAKAYSMINDILEKQVDPKYFFGKEDLDRWEKLTKTNDEKNKKEHRNKKKYGNYKEEAHSHADGTTHAHGEKEGEHHDHGHKDDHHEQHKEHKASQSYSYDKEKYYYDAKTHQLINKETGTPKSEEGKHVHKAESKGSHSRDSYDKEKYYYDMKTYQLINRKTGNPKSEEEKENEPKISVEDQRFITAFEMYKSTLESIDDYYLAVSRSPEIELDTIVNALSGGYVAPASGGDPIVNPKSIPAGRNTYGIDAEKTPTKEAWNVGVKLAKKIIESKLQDTGDYPKKVAFTLWSSEFVRQQGITIAEIFYLVGVEPVRNSRGSVYDVQLVPIEKLKRPRIDVIVQTSGQFRDLGASRIYLINKAVDLAANANDDDKYKNYVKEGNQLAEKVMKEKGATPEKARALSNVRVFGGVNGNYGTAIMEMVEKGDSWEEEDEVATQYLLNMGAMYGKDNWAQFQPGMFEAAIQNTDTIVQPRSANTWGPLSLDHVYEFMGGLNNAIRYVTGNEPDGYFSDLRNPNKPRIQGAKEAIWQEARTTLLNPKYINALQQGGASSAEVFAETMRDTYGWDVMKPEVIDEELWDGLYDVYVQDKYNLEIEQFFRDKNPYALQEMTAIMLEVVRKGYWSPGEEVVKDIAKLHAQLIKDFKAGCSGFVCNNAKLREMISQQLDPELKQDYLEKINSARIGKPTEEQEGMELKKEKLNLEKIKETFQESIGVIVTMLILIGLFIFAVVFGARRKQG